MFAFVLAATLGISAGHFIAKTNTQADYIRDLQRRVGQLEQKLNR